MHTSINYRIGSESFSFLASDRIVSINFPTDGKLRARKVVSRSRARPTGKYPSWKTGRMIQWESPHELNVIRALDSDPAVKIFFEQPAEIEYILNGEQRKHYPDVLVVFNDRKEFWEIKPRVETTKQEIIWRTLFMTKALPEYGYQYRLLAGEYFTKEPNRSNALTVLKYGRTPVSPLDRERVRRTVSINGEIMWHDLISGALGPLGRSHVCRLILEGVLVFDFGSSLTPSTRIFFVSPERRGNQGAQP
jgi:hypothetical protein